MRKDVLDLHEFYGAALGRAARSFIAARIADVWEGAKGLRVAGFGYAAPYLPAFENAERALALAPDAQGVMAWPPGEKNRAMLVDEHRWPLPDASIDRLLIIHGLEEAGDPSRLMREAWRVLAGDGRVIVVVAHRRGLWSIIDTTPFAAGRPYLRGQLINLLTASMFRPQFATGALFFPPFDMRFLLRAAPAWERAGARLWPGLGGVVMVEASKELFAPAASVQRARRAALRAPGVAAPVSRALKRPRRAGYIAATPRNWERT
ncbi:MAG: methyltransferase domain-containing protein [Alphaproteobacteria bacterium]|nr:methyltransferase domain-containing protein [Alphaproteobacteria bacterium]